MPALSACGGAAGRDSAVSALETGFGRGAGSQPRPHAAGSADRPPHRPVQGTQLPPSHSIPNSDLLYRYCTVHQENFLRLSDRAETAAPPGFL